MKAEAENFEEFDTERQLQCLLNDEEWDRYAQEMARQQNVLINLEEQKKEYDKTLNAEIKVARDAVEELAPKVEKHAEDRAIKVHGKRDYAHGKKYLTRMDTMATWEETMTPEEMQLGMPLDEKGN